MGHQWRSGSERVTSMPRFREGGPPAKLAPSGPIVGQSAAVRLVLEQVEQVASRDSTVLLLGETGTGKELFATLLHELSARHGRTMVRVNCSAIPATLMESELFGREKGAFTDAFARQIGRFELADHSTIFLDEIGDLPPEIQVKLLRVLEEQTIERLGSPKGIRVDVRVVAATHQHLDQRIAEGSFREDLFYRLNVFPIRIPPLRERVDDIPLLAWRFVEEFSEAFGKRINTIPRENMTELQRYSWPGNIRELRNVIYETLVYKRAGTEMLLSDLPRRVLTRTADAEPESTIDRSVVTRKMERGAMNLKEEIMALQRIAIEEALKRTGGNAAQAARLLGEVGRGVARDPGGTLRAMMRRLAAQ
jgi:formate hydrogenlyase transcriptional activator